MFDWNDEEITNIIWGEARESDDHIVPYPDGSEEKPSGLYGDQSRKERNEGAKVAKPAEQKKPVKTDLHGVKLESSLQYDRNESLTAKGLQTESWPDISLSNAAKTDHETIRTEASNILTEISKHDSSMHGETAEFSNCSEIFENQQEREEDDLVDYGWANIGSFDDLDRIFSNDGPVFGHASLSDADQLWSSSKDLTRSPEKSQASFHSPCLATGALQSTLDQFETKSEYIQPQDHPSVSGFGNMNTITSNAPQNLQAMGYIGGKATLLGKEKTVFEVSGKIPSFNSQLSAGTLAVPDKFTDKGNQQKRLLKTQVKAEEKSEVRELQEICSTWSASGNHFQQFGSHYAPTMGQPYSPLLMSQQRQLSGSESSQYKHLPAPILASSIYANMPSQYPSMTVLSQLHPGEGNHPKVTLGYEVSPSNSDPLNKLLDAPMKPLTMTPQEKIEKLRRRQQMRAMLAIQKQRRQLSNQVSSTEHPIMEGAKSEVEENLNILPTLDPNSPVEQDDSSTVHIPSDRYSAQDHILYQLEDIVGKMDIRIRLCIRDSLFRLAQSTKQRKYASNTSSSNRGNRDKAFNKEHSYSHNRFARMPNVETETNPIDRTVAHLLFHKPLVSSGIIAERPPLSAKLHFERKEAGSMSLSRTFIPQSSWNKQMLSHDESQVSLLFPQGDQSKSSLRVDSSKNASNNEAADGAALGIEASRRENRYL